ncbi:MAG TPA: deiodinase-like protein [Candidatus Sulfotelmatobacter sp.]|nr:deiodinase-like protein [Candidatus Sulfotelmatobacter sp.]
MRAQAGDQVSRRDHGFDNKTESAYTGWPERIYLIDRNGRVLYKSKPGPFGFKPDELERALKKMGGAA